MIRQTVVFRTVTNIEKNPFCRIWDRNTLVTFNAAEIVQCVSFNAAEKAWKINIVHYTGTCERPARCMCELARSRHLTSRRMKQSWRRVSSIQMLLRDATHSPAGCQTQPSVARQREDGRRGGKRKRIRTALVCSTVSTADSRQSRMTLSRGTMSISNRGMAAKVTNVGSTIR